MKLRTTTPASNSFIRKVSLIFVSISLLVFIPIQFMNQNTKACSTVNACQAEIDALEREVAEYLKKSDTLNKKAMSLKSTLAELANQKAIIQAKLDISQAKYNKLQKQISDTEKKIKDNKDALGRIIADLYVDDKITPIEMLASSKNISEYLDKQEFRYSVRSQLTGTISQIKDLKAQLVKQQADIKVVLDEQKAQRANLVAKQQQQQDLLNQTQGQEAVYQQLVASNKKKLADISAQQRSYYQSLLNGGTGVNSGVSGDFRYYNWSGNQGCGGGYPYCGRQDSHIDPWGLYNRECVSYVAWALVNRFGRYVGNFSGEGNAWEWAAPHTKPNGSWNPVGSAISYSSATRVYDPQPGDAVVLPQSGKFSPIGHLMIVESVNGGTIHVSQYNFYGTGEYSTMDIGTGGVVFLRFLSA